MGATETCFLAMSLFWLFCGSVIFFSDLECILLAWARGV